ncbi:MAG: hypothetical protein OEV40_17195 [Acidimicrobiia bacterium]|nr:hypothetical protein [Acidimicrobiia bacterium]
MPLTASATARVEATPLFDFTGAFECEPASDGSTVVTHSYEFRFTAPFRLAERLPAGWLQAQVEEEVEQLALTLDRRANDRPPS